MNCSGCRSVAIIDGSAHCAAPSCPRHIEHMEEATKQLSATQQKLEAAERNAKEFERDWLDACDKNAELTRKLEAAEARIKASQEQEQEPIAYIVQDDKLLHPVLCWAQNTSVSYDNSITVKEPIALYLAAPQPETDRGSNE